MGAWGTNIKDNDTTADIYSDFFDLYNEGLMPFNISKKLIADNKELIENPEDCNNFWFALALAQWETKSLTTDIFDRIKVIIDTDDDLKIWKELDADEKDLAKRKIVLQNFLLKLQKERQKAKPREKPRNVKAIFATGDCLTFKLSNGNFGGIVILATDNNPKLGYNLVAGTRINQPDKPSIKDFKNAEILIKNYAFWKDSKQIHWVSPDSYEKEHSSLFELVGNISIEKEYKTDGKTFVSYNDDWSGAKQAFDMQLDHEKTNLKPTTIITVKELVTEKKWWRF